MTEDRVAKAIQLLEQIVAHDQQGAAIRVLTNPPSCPFERLETYADQLNEVACTDIQAWARLALVLLKG